MQNSSSSQLLACDNSYQQKVKTKLKICMITVNQVSFAKSSNHHPSGEAMLISHYCQAKEEKRKGTKKYKVTACI